MPATYTQANRPMAVTTPLGTDALLLLGLSGHEGLSQLFRFQLDLIADNSKAGAVAFDKVLGQPVTVRLELPNKQQRYFNGICSRIGQGESGTTFTEFRMEVVPRLWLLTKKAQSRIFQHETVPQILDKVLKKDWGLDVEFILPGTWHPRDFVVQYRETDFNFVSRVMEEEGIFYYFKHANGSHKLVVASSAQAHADLPTNPTITYKNLSQSTAHDQDIIYDWSKTQEVTSGKVTLWDHCFELPHKHLEADRTIQDSVQVGKVAHKLKFGENGKLELYDWPGEYAQRFDGIDRGGGERPADVQKIFEDNARTANLRMQQEAAAGVVVQGASNCRQLVAGHKFTVQTLAGDPQTQQLKPDGVYVLTGVSHAARVGNAYSSGAAGAGFDYHNTFTCIPVALPFRPPRTTPKPVVPGTQTAVVVGPAGEEIFTDKYGRIKVQFHWDRQGQNNADSSCWVRVGTPWAGKQWGMIHIPRIGQEVIVDFLEGDPDQPIVVGGVYNAEMMPPYALPGNKTQSGIKSRSSLKGGEENFNEICFEDKKGEEFIYYRAEKDNIIAVENDESFWVGRDRVKEVDRDETVVIGRDRDEHVKNNENILIDGHRSEEVKKSETILIRDSRSETVDKDETISIGGSRRESVAKDESISISGGRTETVDKDETVTVGGKRTVTVEKDNSLSVQQNISMVAKRNINLAADGKVGQGAKDSFIITSEKEITIQCGEARIVMKKNGDISISGAKITVKGTGKCSVKGSESTLQ